ncbi:MAG: flagellar basal body rod protein FlgB [Planctomycetota bacterium]|jgi:flagellar basal-body rod protein FlgB
MLTDLFNTGSMPTLERVVQFTGRRHDLLTHNIANLSTPNFRPRDLDVDSFQAALAEAVDRRRDQIGGMNRELKIDDTRQVEFQKDHIRIRPGSANDNLMFHDRNNRSLEHTMQDLAENTMTHNAALDMLKSQFTMLRTAIRGQV